MISGYTKSRLVEFEKYVVTEDFYSKYVSGSPYVNGVDFDVSVPNQNIIYYINGIRYEDTYVDDEVITIFRFEPNSINEENFIIAPYYKDFSKEGIIDKPKIDNDVFIIRQNLSVFDINYKLEQIETLNDIETYAGGNFFNIIKNT